MKLINVAKTFPALVYWARLPGFAAFCGVSGGICAARIWLLSMADELFLTSIPLNLIWGIMVLTAGAGIFCRRMVLRVVFFGICGMALFAGSELGLRDFYGRMEAVTENHQIMTLTVRISSPVAEKHGGYRFRAKVIKAEDVDVNQALKGKTLQCMSRRPVPPYGVMTVQGRYAIPRPAAGPLGYDQREHFAINGISGGFSISRILSDKDDIASSPTEKLTHKLRTGVQRVIGMAQNPNARAILHAAFLDEKEHLTDDLRTVLRKSGVVHLLAISGFHAALLYTAIFTGLGLLAIPPRPRKLIALAALWGYLFFIGFIPSLFRTTVMATFVCASMMMQRKNHVVHTLGISGFFWLCMSPHSLFAPGFQLSFAATAGIVLMPQIFEGITKAINMRIRNKQAEFISGKIFASFWMSVAATVSTAPTLFYHFGMISIYGIIYNMVAIPLMGAALWAFLMALVLSPVDFLARMAIWCADKLLGLMIYLAGFCEYVPMSEVVVPDVMWIQLVAMTAFMVGLCLVAKNLRGAYALRVGAGMMLILAVTVWMSSTGKTTENLEFRAKNSSVNIIIHKDNKAWIIAQGRRNEVRNLRLREIEPLLYRKGVKDVPLVLIDENAEEEAHEFAFSTGMNPRIITIRNRRGNRQDDYEERYTRIGGGKFINADGACSLWVNSGGKVKINVQKQPSTP